MGNLRLILLIAAVIHGSVTYPVSANRQTGKDVILLEKKQLISEAEGKERISMMVQSSDLIIRGKVISTESQWKEDSRGRHIYTNVTVKVLDKIKGYIKEDAFAFEVVGGTVDDIGEVVSNTPAFEINEDVIVFLAGYPPTIQYGTNGKIPIYDDRVYRDDLEITVDSFIRALKILGQDPNAPISLQGKYRAPTEGIAAADCFIYSGFKWPGTSPVVSYKINQNTSDCTGEGAAVQSAASTWNNASANFTFRYDGSHTSTSASSNGSNEIMWGTTDSVATAYRWFVGDTIKECDVVFNDPSYSWSCTTPGTSQMDVQSVALHEFGHWLSLDDLYDYADRDNVMYGYISKGQVQRTLQPCDIAGICYIYGCPPPPCSITVTSPTGSSSWATGTSHTIMWYSSNNPGSYVKIQLYKGSSLIQTITLSTYDDGSYSWTPSTSLADGSDYRIKISATTDSSCYDYSSYFTIYTPCSCSITITSPTGSSSWECGNCYYINWDSECNPSNYVKIQLYKGASLVQTVISSTLDDGSYSWCVPQEITPGCDYRIKISSYTDSYCSDYSNYFCITCCSITVTSPDGGWWELGEVLDIDWLSGGTSGNVKIEFYEGGSIERVIKESTPDTGSYDWPIPIDGSLTGSDDYQVKVTDVSNSSCYDFSNNFGIATPPEAQDDSITAFVDTPVVITLQATDEGYPDPPAALTYIITSLPVYGDLYDPCTGDPCTVLVGYSNQVEYIPHIGYEGQDSFTFIANDGGVAPGGGDSREATVSINVTACIFFEDFPSTTLDIANWTETSGSPTIDGLADGEPSPPYSLHLENTDAVTGRVIDLSECFSAQLHYWWKSVSTESADDLYVDYWDGNEWQLLQIHPGGANTSWEQNSMELPGGALHSEFRFHFWVDCDSSTDEWYIDDLCIQYQSCIDHPFLRNEPNTTKGLCNTVYWDPVADANDYYVERATDVNFTNIIDSSGWITDKHYEFCSLENGQIYWYRVRAWVPFPLETWLQTAQPDFETDVLTDTTATSDGKVVLAKTGTPTVDTVGGTDLNTDTGSDGYFNGFLATTDTILTQIEVYLGISTSSLIEFVVYEGGMLFTDPYYRIYSSGQASSGTGTKFYSSGAISVELEAGRHYMIGAVWSGSVRVYISEGHSSPGFADHTGWGYCTGFPSPASLSGSDIRGSAFTCHHKYTSVENNFYTESGGVVSSAIELPANCTWVWDVVDFNATIPPNTDLMVHVLRGTDESVLLYDVESGTDINNISETSIKLSANLSTDDPNDTPALADWSVRYHISYESEWSNVESSRQCNTPGDFEPDCDVDWTDLRVLCDEWLLGELSADVYPDGGDGFVNFLDWAIFADGWQTTNDIFDLAEFAEQWLKYMADIAPGSGDGLVNLLDFAALAENWLLDLTGPLQN